MAGLDCRLLTAAVCSERGRPLNNEDNYLMNGRFKPLGGEDLPRLEQCAPVPLGVYAVCDGMGGTSFGEVAAAMAMIQDTVTSIRPMERFFIGLMFSFPSTAHRTLPKFQRAQVL